MNCRVLKNGLCEITQEFGGNHIGIDLVGKNYTIDDIVAHSDGVITYVQTGKQNNQGSTGDESYGNFVKIDHGDGFETLYAHLDSANVKVGDKVVKGQFLGSMGNTGNSYGAHLHFEIIKNGTRINPYEYLDKDLFENIINTVTRDETKNQLKVNVIDLRIRKEASINAQILGVATLDGIYNYYETKENEGYTWYRIDDNEWIAGEEGWITLYPIINEVIDETERLKLEIEKLTNQIILLEQENENLKKANQGFKIFIAPNSGLYYILLSENEKLTYKKDA